MKGIDSNIRHEAIPVPSGPCPFDQEGLLLFEQGIDLLVESEDLPDGYGVTLAELDGDGFNEHEDINIGLQKKGVLVELPSQIWKPRTELWVKGLFAMTSLLAL